MRKPRKSPSGDGACVPSRLYVTWWDAENIMEGCASFHARALIIARSDRGTYEQREGQVVIRLNMSFASSVELIIDPPCCPSVQFSRLSAPQSFPPECMNFKRSTNCEYGVKSCIAYIRLLKGSNQGGGLVSRTRLPLQVYISYLVQSKVLLLPFCVAGTTVQF